MLELSPALAFESCAPETSGLCGPVDGLPQMIVIERNGVRVEVGVSEFRDWWPDSKPIWVFPPSFYYTSTHIDEGLARCALSLEVGLANP